MAGRIKYYGGIVTDSLSLYLDAAKKDSYIGDGNKWNDISRNKHIASLNGNIQFTRDYFGEFNLDGSDDYFTIPQSSGDFSKSICCYDIWCYPTSFPNGGQIIWMDRSTYNGLDGIEIFTNDASGTLALRGSGGLRVNSTETLNLNQWNHVVVNYNGSSAECYINNVYENLGTISQVLPSSYDLYIGKYPTITDNYDWNGKIAIAKVYSKNLSSDEVSQNYNALKRRFNI